MAALVSSGCCGVRGECVGVGCVRGVVGVKGFDLLDSCIVCGVVLVGSDSCCGFRIENVDGVCVCGVVGVKGLDRLDSRSVDMLIRKGVVVGEVVLVVVVVVDVGVVYTK